MADAMKEAPVTAPSGAEVLAGITANMADTAIQAAARSNVVEDYRRTSPKPRNAIVPDYMQVPNDNRAGDCVAVIYVLTEKQSGEPRYVGCTTVSTSKRISWHRGHSRKNHNHNPDLAAFLASGNNDYHELASCPDDERFELEANITRRFREKYELLNVLDGTKHTPESIKRILAGKQHAKASRAGECG